MNEEKNKLTYETALDKYTEAVHIINLRSNDEEQNFWAQGQADAWEEVLTLMGHEVKTSLFIDENGFQSIPYVVIDGIHTDMMNPFLNDILKNPEEPEETSAPVEPEVKPKRRSRKNKKASYLNLYKAVCPEYEVDTSSKYDKIMDNVLNQFTKDERTYIIKRFGLDGDGNRTYRQIAEEDGNISRSTVTKIIERVLETIHSIENIELLKEAFVASESFGENKPVQEEFTAIEAIPDIEKDSEPKDFVESVETENIEDSNFLLGEEDIITDEPESDEDDDPDFLDDPPDDLDEEPSDEEDPFNMPF